MKNRTYHNASIVFILISYLFVGASGFIEALTIFSCDSYSQQIEQAQPGPSPTSKAYITQYKHVTTAVKIEIPSPAIIIEPVFHRIQVYINFYDAVHSVFYLDPLISLNSSRAPPFA